MRWLSYATTSTQSVSYLTEEGAATPAEQFNLRVTGEVNLTNMIDHICLYHDAA
jgi:hypothetical protein